MADKENNIIENIGRSAIAAVPPLAAATAAWKGIVKSSSDDGAKKPDQQSAKSGKEIGSKAAGSRFHKDAVVDYLEDQPNETVIIDPGPDRTTDVRPSQPLASSWGEVTSLGSVHADVLKSVRPSDIINDPQLHKLGSNLWVTGEQEEVMENIASTYGFNPGSSPNTLAGKPPRPIKDLITDPEARARYISMWNEAFNQSTIRRESDGKLVWIRDRFDAEVHYRIPTDKAHLTEDSATAYYMMKAHATKEPVSGFTLKDTPIVGPNDPSYLSLLNEFNERNPEAIRLHPSHEFFEKMSQEQNEPQRQMGMGY